MEKGDEKSSEDRTQAQSEQISYRPLPYTESRSVFQRAFTKGSSELGSTLLTWLPKAFPCKPFVTLVDAYSSSVASSLKQDVIAGLTVGIMIIPQSMAYAMIAGLPNQYGLYSSFMPLLIYAALGSSRQLAVGPVAIISLLTKDSISSFIDKDEVDYTQKYINAALTMAFIAGIIQTALGCLRLGFVVNLMSHCVISGFTSAAAVLIGMSQLKHVFGFDIEHTETIQGTMKDIIKGIKNGEFHTETFVMSVILIITLMTMRKLSRKYKKLSSLKALGPLIVSIFSAVLVYLTRIDKSMNIKIVGTIPVGLPPISSHRLNFDHFSPLFTKSLVIALLGFVESIAIAEAIASKNGYELNVNQELFGVGVANMIGSCFSSYAVTGSFSRSAVNNESGAKSTVASLFTAFMVLLALVLLSGPLKYLPKSALAAIVISSVSGLIDIDEAKFLSKVHNRDLLLWFAACFGTLLLGVELGIAVSVSASLACVIYETAQPHTAILGQIPGTYVYRSVRQYRETKTHKDITILRIDAPLYFANVAFVKEKVRKICAGLSSNYMDEEELSDVSISKSERSHSSTARKFIILEMGPVINCDSSGAHALKHIVEECKRSGAQVCLSNPNGNVLRVLEKAEVINAMGRDWLFLRVHEAVQSCLLVMKDGGHENELESHKLQHRSKRENQVIANTL